MRVPGKIFLDVLLLTYLDTVHRQETGYALSDFYPNCSIISGNYLRDQYWVCCTVQHGWLFLIQCSRCLS